MEQFSIEGGNVFLGEGTNETTVEAPSVSEKSIILLTQIPNGTEAFRIPRVSSITAGKRFVVKLPASEGKVAFSWAVLN